MIKEIFITYGLYIGLVVGFIIGFISCCLITMGAKLGEN